MPPSPELLTVKLKTPPGLPQYVYQMKRPIELNNIAVETVYLKCTTPLNPKGKQKVKVKMYGKCMKKCLQTHLSV